MIQRRRIRLLGAAAAIVTGRALAAVPVERVFALAIANGRVPQAMQVIRVQQGERVRLELTSDRPLTIHLHGYDLERTLAPGRATVLAFDARATGRFPANVHEEGRAGGHAERTVFYLEVHPR